LKLGLDMRLYGPRDCWPDEGTLAHLREAAVASRAPFKLTDRPDEAVPGADFVYTDV